MRIALVHPRASDVGGVERQAHSVAVGLLDAGHEVHYVCERADANVDPRLEIHRVPKPLRFARATKVWLFDVLSRRALAAAGPFDLVHGFGKTSRQDVYYDGSGCLADFQSYSIDATHASPLARALRRASLHQRVAARIERARYTPGNYRRILAISELVRGQILRRYGLPPEDVETLHPGVDLERFHPGRAAAARPALRAELGLAADAPLVVLLGSDYRRKGLPCLLEALAALPGVHAAVVGREKPRRVREYRDLARQLGVADRVHVLGLRRDPEHVLAAADCMVFPSHFDAFGSAVLEAMACGVPTVVSRRAGAAELVVEGKTGALVDGPEEPDALAAGVRSLLGERGAEAGRQARREAERHSWEAHVARVFAVYRDILGEVAPAERVPAG